MKRKDRTKDGKGKERRGRIAAKKGLYLMIIQSLPIALYSLIGNAVIVFYVLEVIKVHKNLVLSQHFVHYKCISNFH